MIPNFHLAREHVDVEEEISIWSAILTQNKHRGTDSKNKHMSKTTREQEKYLDPNTKEKTHVQQTKSSHVKSQSPRATEPI